MYFTIPPDFYCDESIHNLHEVVREGAWDEDRLMFFLPQKFARHIIENIKPPVLTNELNKPFWIMEARENFTVMSAWDYFQRRREPNTVFRNIWVKGLPFKVVFFMWKV